MQIYDLFYIRIFVHPNINPNYNQEDATFLDLLLQTLYKFQAVPSPIIRST